jgi:polysaccharide biosynthesis protein PslE
MFAAPANSRGYRNVIDDIAGALWRRRGTMIAVFLITVLGAFAALQFMGEQYEAQASLLVKIGRENAELPLTVEKGELFTSGVQKEEINSIIQLLASRNLAEDAVDKIGIDPYLARAPRPTGFIKLAKYQVKQAARYFRQRYDDALIALDLRKELPDRERVIKMVESRLMVVRDKDSNVINISLRLSNGELARHTVETLIDLYLQRHIELRRSASIGEVFEKQIALYQQQLRQIQENVARIKSEGNVHSVPEQRSALLSRLRELRSKIEESRTQDDACARQESVLRARLADMSASAPGTEVVTPNPVVKSLKESLTALEVERVKLASQYLEGSEQLAALDEQIRGVRDILDQEPATQAGDRTLRSNPIREDLQKQLEETTVNRAGLQAAIVSAGGQMAPIEEELRKLNASEDQLHMAQLEQRVVEDKYQTYASRREEARIADELDARRVANVVTLAPATAGPEPVYPRKLFIMAASLAAGLLLAAGLALVFESRDQTIRRADDLNDIEGVKCLGTFHLTSPKSAA